MRFSVINWKQQLLYPVDESTDFTNKCYAVSFVRFVNYGKIEETFFCCKELPETGKGQDIFNVLFW
jgi:hypothetical protein